MLAVSLLVSSLILAYALERAHHRIARLVRRQASEDRSLVVGLAAEVVAQKVGPALATVDTYRQRLENELRAACAAAQTRALVRERQAADTVTALEAAVALVVELRAALDAQRPPAVHPAPPEDSEDHRPTEPTPQTSPSGRPPLASSARPVAVGRPYDEGDDEEETQVGQLPAPQRVPQLHPPPPAGAPGAP